MIGVALIATEGQGVTFFKPPPFTRRDQFNHPPFAGQIFPGTTGMRNAGKLTAGNQFNPGDIESRNRFGQQWR